MLFHLNRIHNDRYKLNLHNVSYQNAPRLLGMVFEQKWKALVFVFNIIRFRYQIIYSIHVIEYIWKDFFTYAFYICLCVYVCKNMYIKFFTYIVSKDMM